MSIFLWRNHPRFAWLAAAAILFTADQLSKYWFSATIPFGASIKVTDWFNLVHVRNSGAAFSLLADAGGWQQLFFIIIGGLVIVPTAYLCVTRQIQPLERVAGALIVGGGGGNLTDRIASGAVTDFLDFHWRGLHWPAFNLADVFIVLAAAAWIMSSFRSENPISRIET